MISIKCDIGNFYENLPKTCQIWLKLFTLYDDLSLFPPTHLPGDIKSTYRCSLRVKWCHAVRIADDVQTLRERVIMKVVPILPMFFDQTNDSEVLGTYCAFEIGLISRPMYRLRFKSYMSCVQLDILPRRSYKSLLYLFIFIHCLFNGRFVMQNRFCRAKVRTELNVK
jgi:hypothetical protein